MTNRGPIIIVEDDLDDVEVLKHVLTDLNLKNEIIYFNAAEDAFTFLKEESKQPFLVICDINMPRMNGLELKRLIEKGPVLRYKTIPFVFLSTAASKKAVEEAFFEMAVQGFIKKPNSITEMKRVISVIIDYWSMCQLPDAKTYSA